jgi:hypothetical protein
MNVSVTDPCLHIIHPTALVVPLNDVDVRKETILHRGNTAPAYSA